MNLILFRHGLAVSREEFQNKKMHDSLRPLTERGRERTMSVARLMREQIEEVQLLVSSPLLRAQQTAEVIQKVLPFERYLESSELSPEAPPQAFASWLKSQAPHVTSVLAVGHEPQLSVFGSWILTGFSTPVFELKKSGIAIFELESFDSVGPRSAELRVLLSPKWV